MSFVETASPCRVSAAIHKKGSGNVAINVRNSYDLTTAEGYVVYTINQGNKARAVYHEPIAVAPGKSAEVEVPSDRLGLVPKNASVEVFVYTTNHAPGYNATSEPTKGPDPSKIKNGGTLTDL